ncbi:MAG: hypothetical protein NZ951_04910 [Dehalococcoidia bacterium]|nr:hypothetical protein [Dehalococcoidia bacterium]MDW8120015.1 hypothetical protein [Chloroflexota bacterium]
MAWLVRGLVVLVDGALALLDLLRALLGAVRFALVSGLSPAYLRQRREWFSRKMLGRPLGVRGILAFGLWHADLRRGRRGTSIS